MRKFINWTLIVLGIVGLILTGCFQSTPESPAQATAEELSELRLVGTSWELERFGEPGDDLAVLPGPPLTIHYFGERYSGFGGCNWYLGVYSIEGINMTMDMPATSDIICEPEGLMEQEATFITSLTNVTEYRMDGDKLLAYTVEDQLMLTFVPAKSVPFEGTTWELKLVFSDDLWVPLITGTTITAQFEGDQLSGFAGCNNYTATVESDDGSLKISNLVVTEKTCTEPDGVMDQENAYLSALPSVAGYMQAGYALAMLDSEDETIMMLGVPY